MPSLVVTTFVLPGWRDGREMMHEHPWEHWTEGLCMETAGKAFAVGRIYPAVACIGLHKTWVVCIEYRVISDT
jgi:hypothetical protein